MFRRRYIPLWYFFLCCCCIMVGCTTPTPPREVRQTVIDPAFQTRLLPQPTVPAYRCGSWASNNAPGAYSTVTIYARLMNNAQGVSGALARAVAHFSSGDMTLDQLPVSDHGGYVQFTLPLAGRQPGQVPVTVDVLFTLGSSREKVACAPAFFTPW